MNTSSTEAGQAAGRAESGRDDSAGQVGEKRPRAGG